jgi:hypothetical protein
MSGLGQKGPPSFVAGGDGCSPKTGRRGGWPLGSAGGGPVFNQPRQR